MQTELQGKLIEKWSNFEFDDSHGLSHINDVLENAAHLQKIYGGDEEIIIAASVLHDLGRSIKGLHQSDSRDQSLRLAHEILTEIGFPIEKVEQVLVAIQDHDQPALRPRTLEGRILKDADFLGGFGARGILRSGIWTGASGQKESDAIERLEVKMRSRIENLEFPESKQMAVKKYQIVRLFLAILKEEAQNLEIENFPGEYIVFEGISGSGKDTQANLLASDMEIFNKKVRVVHEPTDKTMETVREWRGKTNNNLWAMTGIFVADRASTIGSEVIPQLREGGVAIGIRSFISNMVYQAENEVDRELIRIFNERFVPSMKVVYLDVDPEVALSRVNARAAKTGQPLGYHEQIDKMALIKQKYSQVLDSFSNVIYVDANQPTEVVHKDIMDKYIGNRKK